MNAEMRQGKLLTNFGRNIRFVPKYWYRPNNEAQVLELLDRHADGKIRAIASLHSWSDVVPSEDVVVDMSQFARVEIETAANGEVLVTAGGGCILQKLLDTIHRQTDATLPTLGAIKKQTIAGAISTGTHGSGKHSLSHYLDELRVAAYDSKTGKAKIYTWNEGLELRAARCALGCMGIILSVKFRCVPEYRVEETICCYDTLAEVLNQESEFPLQEFLLVPYLWQYFVYQRRVVPKQSASLGQMVRSYWYRAYKLLVADIAFHCAIEAMLFPWVSPDLIRWFYQSLFSRLLVQNSTVADSSEPAITRKHQLFRHLEMEVFVPARNFLPAMKLVRSLLSFFAGIAESAPDELSQIGMLESLEPYRGSYTHHYPLFCRRVLPDDTLISMTSSADEPYYTISFFTYLKQKTQFYEFANFLARSLTQLYDARLHWGKYYPLNNQEIEPLYPQLAQFREICWQTDPKGVFRNDYTRRVLGFVEAQTPTIS